MSTYSSMNTIHEASQLNTLIIKIRFDYTILKTMVKLTVGYHRNNSYSGDKHQFSFCKRFSLYLYF